MYRERPSTLVNGLVLWELVTIGLPARILPDGCMDIIILGDRPVVAGADTRARFFTGPSGMRCVGGRFAPGLLPAVLAVPAAEFVDRVIGLAELGPTSLGTTSARTFVDQVLSAADPLDGIDAALALFTSGADDPVVRLTATMLAAGVSVAEVAAVIGYSPRQLQRRSTNWFGYGPKQLAAVLRFQRALALGRTGLPGAGAALAAGYADQAHLARECRRLGGATFTELTGPRPAMPAQAGSGA